MHNRKLLSAALAALVCAGAVSTQAAVVWSSHDVAVDPSDNTIWSNGLNWAGGLPPVNGDDIELGIPVANGSRITSNDSLTQIGNLLLKANLNEANGNGVDLLGNAVGYTAGGTSIGRIGMAINLTQDTTYSVSANTSNGRLEVGGAITGNAKLTKADAGRLRFAGTAKTYTGDTIVTGGILDMSAADMMPFGAGKGNLYVGAAGQFFLNNVNTQINGLHDNAGAGGFVNKTGSNTRNLTLGNNDASGAFSGSISFTGGSSTIIKVGTGTQILSGPVSVAGAGAVNGGGLIVNGTWTGNLNATAPGTIGGTGTITGSVGGTGNVSPGQSIGTLNVGTYGGAGVLVIDLDGSGAGSSDVINVLNALDLNNLSVDLNELVPVDDSAYVIAKYGSLVGTQFLNVTDLPAGYSIDYDYDDGVSTKNIALVVPEPAALSALLGLTLFARRRRV